MGKTITFCNQKGGVGKTTTAVNLGACVAHLGKKVLVVDFDPQGNATSGLGVDKKEIKSTVYNVLIGKSTIEETVCKTCVNNLYVLPSNIHLTGAEIELVSSIGREYKLKNELKKIAYLYDYIFIDAPPSLGLLTINSLVAADAIIIPLQCEYYALEGLSQLIDTINLVKDSLNSNLIIEGVLLTMADKRTKLTAEVVSEARKYFKDKVFNAIIPRNIKLSEAPGYGKPIIAYDELSVGAVKYSELAQEFITNNSIATVAPVVSSTVTNCNENKVLNTSV